MADFRDSIHECLADLAATSDYDLRERGRHALLPEVIFDVAHPVNRLAGIEAVVEGFYRPLRRALHNMQRRDEIFIGGRNRWPEGGDWVAAITHYVGNFREPLLGIAPSDRLVFLRAGEFYRIEGGRIAEAKILIDLLDLMHQAGQLQMLFPAPASHDGVLPGRGEGGEVSLDIVEAMLADLHSFDARTFGSKGQIGRAGHWHEDMLWYGPGGIGSSYRWDGFVKGHREPFLRAFPDRKGGNHYCRIGDSNYAAV